MTMLIFAGAFFGAGLLLPSYFQQALHHTPMQAGVYLIPQGLGAMLTMRMTGTAGGPTGPGKIVLVGIRLILAAWAPSASVWPGRPNTNPRCWRGWRSWAWGWAAP